MKIVMVSVTGAATVAPALSAMAHVAGGDASRHARVRLERIWPTFMQWDTPDRAFV